MPYLFIKVAVEEVSPVFLSFLRVAMAAAILLPLAWRSGALRGTRGRWVAIAAFALFEIVIPFPLIAFGEQHVSSSFAAIVISALPLTIAVLAIRFDQEERVRGSRLAGLFVGLAGVVVLFGIDVAGSADELLGASCILLATVGYAIGPLIIKRHLATVDPIGAVGLAMVVATVALAPAALLSAPTETPSGDVLASLAVLGVLCTALAFVLYFTLIAEVGPSRASVITYVNPIVAVALGVTILGEPVTASAVAGLLLILAGRGCRREVVLRAAWPRSRAVGAVGGHVGSPARRHRPPSRLEVLDEVVERLLLLLGGHDARDRLADLLERAVDRRPDPLDAEDVEPELRPDRPAGAAAARREERAVERRLLLALLDPGEQPAAAPGDLVDRVPPSDRPPARAGGERAARPQGPGARPGQDDPDVASLGAVEPVLVGVVVRAQLIGRGRRELGDGLAQAGRRDLEADAKADVGLREARGAQEPAVVALARERLALLLVERPVDLGLADHDPLEGRLALHPPVLDEQLHDLVAQPAPGGRAAAREPDPPDVARRSARRGRGDPHPAVELCLADGGALADRGDRRRGRSGGAREGEGDQHGGEGRAHGRAR
jgi:drug/metabolite transporter (DMT)-like permease